MFFTDREYPYHKSRLYINDDTYNEKKIGCASPTVHCTSRCFEVARQSYKDIIIGECFVKEENIGTLGRCGRVPLRTVQFLMAATD
jgi:hypothetical protein